VDQPQPCAQRRRGDALGGQQGDSAGHRGRGDLVTARTVAEHTAALLFPARVPRPPAFPPETCAKARTQETSSMGTRGPPQTPPRRLTALRRRHAVGIGAISAVRRHSQLHFDQDGACADPDVLRAHPMTVAPDSGIVDEVIERPGVVRSGALAGDAWRSASLPPDGQEVARERADDDVGY